MDRSQFLESVRGLREEGKSIRAVASELGVHPSRVQRALKVLSQKRQDAPVGPAGSLIGKVFVGRQQEMSELSAALNIALSGHGQLAMLVGQPGIGKTRTSQELASIAEERGAQVLWGRCYEGQGAPPCWPWIQIIRSYLQGHDLEQTHSAMGMGAADIAEVLPEVKELVPDLEPSPSLEPEQARFRLFDSITSFLKNVSMDQPLVLLLDNLHWADRSSLLLLEFLSQELTDARILVIGTYRDEELFREHPLPLTLGELTKHPYFGRIVLRGLTHEGIHQLIELVSGDAPSEELAEIVSRQSEGNPFFVTEVVRMLAQEGALTQGPAEASERLGLRVPEGVKEAIGRRLHRLSVSCNQVLTVASVVGREFELELMKRLIPELSEERFLGAVEEALSAGIIEEMPDAAGRCQFTHVLIQETLSQELSAARRARLHGEIGEALEGLHADDVEAHADELAYHFAEAEPVLGGLKLVRYSLMAGEGALAAYAWEEALGHFQRGLATKEGQAMDAEKAALLFGLARAQAATLERYRLAEAATTVRPAFEHYVAARDVPKALAIAEYPFRALGERADATQLLADALKLVPSDSHQAGRLLARFGLASIQGFGSFENAMDALDQALAVAQRENDTALERTVLTNMADAHWMMRLNPQESLENGLRAIELDRRVSQIQLDHDGHWYAAVGLIALGDLEGAWPHAAAHLAMAEKRGVRFSIAQALHVNEVVAHLQGNWETARDFSDRGLAVDHRDARLVPNRATLEYELGDFGEGDAYLERLVETMHLSPPGPTLEYSIAPLAIEVAARITGVARQFDIAEAAANTALSSPSTVSFFAQLARTGLALMAVERGDVAVAREQYEALVSWRITMTPLNLMCGHRVLGLLAQTMGRMDDAVIHFEDSLAFCRKAGARPELAWTCHDYAALRQAQGEREKAMLLLDEALAISTELGMRPLREKVSALKVSALKEQAQSQPALSAKYPGGLTEREVEVLQLVAVGRTNREIANELVLSQRTVQRHISNLYAKINVRNRSEATAFTLSELPTSTRTAPDAWS